MGIKIASNFSPRFAKTLDDRGQFATLSAMKNFSSSALTSGVITFNLETHLFYYYDAKTHVDPDLGKWKPLLNNDNIPAIRGVVASYEKLMAVKTDGLVNNDMYIVSNDENHDYLTTIYSYNVDYREWAYSGLFTVDTDPVIYPFIANAFYRLNEVCVHDGKLYSAKKDFTTESKFNADDWNTLYAEEELNALGDRIDTVKSELETTISTLDSKVDQEIADRKSADEELDTKISDTKTELESSISDVDSKLDTEIADRKSSDEALLEQMKKQSSFLSISNFYNIINDTDSTMSGYPTYNMGKLEPGRYLVKLISTYDSDTSNDKNICYTTANVELQISRNTNGKKAVTSACTYTSEYGYARLNTTDTGLSVVVDEEENVIVQNSMNSIPYMFNMIRVKKQSNLYRAFGASKIYTNTFDSEGLDVELSFPATKLSGAKTIPVNRQITTDILETHNGSYSGDVKGIKLYGSGSSGNEINFVIHPYPKGNTYGEENLYIHGFTSNGNKECSIVIDKIVLKSKTISVEDLEIGNIRTGDDTIQINVKGDKTLFESDGYDYGYRILRIGSGKIGGSVLSATISDKTTEIVKPAILDISDTYTKAEVDIAISEAVEGIDLSAYATKEDTYTKAEVDEEIEKIVGLDLEDYATKQYVDDKIQEVDVDLSDYAKIADVNTELDKKLDITTASETYATKEEVEEKIGDIDFSALATKEEVTTLSNSIDSSLIGKADKSTTYTKTEVDTALALKADSTTVTIELGKKLDSETASETYATKTELSSEVEALEAKVSSVYRVKGSKAIEAELPTEGNEIGDVWNVEADGSNFVWTGTEWDKLGGTVDLSGYYTKSETDTLFAKTTSLGGMAFKSASDYATKQEAGNLYAPKSLETSVSDLSEIVAEKANTADLGTMASKSANDYSTTAEANTLYAGKALETTVSELSEDMNTELAQKLGIEEAVNTYLTKTSASETYATKEEVEAKAATTTVSELSGKVSANETVIAELNTTVAEKANSADLGTMSTKSANDYYTAAEVDQHITDIVSGGTIELKGYAKTEEVNKELAKKADKETTYTKTEVDTAISEAVEGIDLSGFATTSSVEALETTVEGKADKATTLAGYAITDSYTKTEAEDKFASKSLETTVSNLSTTVSEKADSSSLGTMASKNATDYSTSAQANALYAGKALETTVSELSTTVAEKADSSTVIELSETVAGKADSETVSELSGKVDTLETTVEGKADKSALEAYLTTVEANALYASKALETTVAGKADKTALEALETTVAGKLDSTTAESTYLKSETAFETYATKAQVEAVEAKISSVYRVKGSKATEADLPTEGNETGDVWNVTADGANYVWTGTEWDKLGADIDLSEYSTTAEANALYAGKALETNVSELSGKVSANETAISELNTTVAEKANSADLGTMASKSAADYSTTAEANGLYAGKSLETTVSDLSGKVDTLETTVAGKLDSTTAESTYLKSETASETYATKTDLEGKVSTETFEEELGNKADNSSIETLLGKVSTNETNISDLSKRVDDIDLSGFATTTQLETLETTVEGKADKSALEAYLTTVEANALYASKALETTVADLSTTVAEKADSSTVTELEKKVEKKLSSDTASETYATKAEVNKKLSSVYRVKGSKATEADLPTEGNETGDVWNVETDGSNFVWTGTEWDKLSGIVDLSSTAKLAEANTFTEVNTFAEKVYIGGDIVLSYSKGIYNSMESMMLFDDTEDTSRETTVLYGDYVRINGNDEVKIVSTNDVVISRNGEEYNNIDSGNLNDNLATASYLSRFVTSTFLTNNYYTTTASNSRYAPKSLETTVSDLSTTVSGKANSSDLGTMSTKSANDYYTIEQINSKHTIIESSIDNLSIEVSGKLGTVEAQQTYATKDEVDQKVASVYRIKGAVDKVSDLPTEGNTIGDVYNVHADGNNYVWDGTQWDKLGGEIDLSDYYTASQVNALYEETVLQIEETKNIIGQVAETKMDKEDIQAVDELPANPIAGVIYLILENEVEEPTIQTIEEE